MNKIIRRAFLAAQFILLCISDLSAFQGDSTALAITMDPSIHYGRLPNGFTYYIKDVPGSPNVLMNMYIKVAGYQEDSTQLNFAHAIEHLAFRTAKHFPQYVSKELKHYNIKTSATTGGVRTVYNLNIPSNHIDTLDVGLLWFRDIANLEITPQAVETEKGALRQEVIFRVGYKLNEYFLETKLFSELFPCKGDFSKFLEHNKNFSSESLIEFYNKWYRPDRMGVIIAGDIENIDILEKQIQQRFADITDSNPPLLDAKECQLNYLKEPRHFISLGRQQIEGAVNKKLVKIYLFFRDSEIFSQQKYATEGLYRHLIWTSIKTLINRRFKNTGVPTSILPPKRSLPFAQIAISDSDNKELQKLEKTIRLLEQAKLFGFTKIEWENVQNDILNTLDETADASYWVEQMSRHFIFQEALPKNKKDHLQLWFSKISLKQINAYTREYLSSIPDDIGIIAPSRHQALSYSESEIRKRIINAIKTSGNPDEFQTKEASKPLFRLEEVADLKKVKYSNRKINKTRIEELVLDNGVKVILHNVKLTGRLKDRILIHGFSSKGALCFPESDYYSAINAPLMVRTAGIGELDGNELQRFISNSGLNVISYIQPLEAGIKIDGTIDNLQSMAQLIYLYFNKPKTIGNEAFKNWLKIERKWYLQPSINPRSIDFDIAMAETLGDKSIVLIGGTKRFKGIAKTDRIKAYEIYRQIFEKASDFTFIISGDFKRESVLPLTQKYLGNLSNSSNVNCLEMRNQLLNFSKQPSYQEYTTREIGTSYRMNGSVNYMLRFVTKSPNPKDWKEHIRVVLLGRLMSRIIRNLRYDKGAALYNFSAHGLYNRYLEAYSLGLYLDCTEQELKWLRDESKRLVVEIKENGVDPEIFKQVKDQTLSLWYKAKSEEGFTPKELYEKYRYNEPIVDKEKREKFVKSLTARDIQKTANKYLNKVNMMEFIFRDGKIQ